MSSRESLKVSVLSVFLVALVASGAWAQTGKGLWGSQRPIAARTAETTPAATSGKRPAADRKIVVYYIHGDARCPSCLKIESYTAEAVKTTFADSLKSGAIEWRPVNSDAKGNEHYMTDYQLVTKSVVLSEVRGGREVRWKNLPKVWELLGDKDSFETYIKREVAAFAKGR